jgi:hypothetical protein
LASDIASNPSIIAYDPPIIAFDLSIVAISAPDAGHRLNNISSFLYGLISASLSKIVQARNPHLYSAYIPTAQKNYRHSVPVDSDLDNQKKAIVESRSASLCIRR